MPIFMQYGSTQGISTSKLSQLHGMSTGFQTVNPRSLIASYGAGAQSPRDVATGQASGKRQHQPITITKEVDKSDVLMTHLLHSGRIIPKLYLNFYSTPSPTGHPLISMNLSDVEVNVARASQSEATGGKRSKATNTMELEKIKFSFQKIEVTFHSGGASAMDDWEART